MHGYVAPAVTDLPPDLLIKHVDACHLCRQASDPRGFCVDGEKLSQVAIKFIEATLAVHLSTCVLCEVATTPIGFCPSGKLLVRLGFEFLVVE